MVFDATFNNISHIVAVLFIGGGNRSTRRKPPICHQLYIYIYVCVSASQLFNNNIDISFVFYCGNIRL